MSFNEAAKKREFIDAYYIRRADETPGMIMDQIGAPKRMLTQWISDRWFRNELDKIDAERLWLAKEVVFRRVGEVFETLSQLASQRGPNSIRAAEVMFRVIGGMKEKQLDGGGDGEEQGSESIDELERQRQEILSILKNAGREGPAAADEDDGTGSEDPETPAA